MSAAVVAKALTWTGGTSSGDGGADLVAVALVVLFVAFSAWVVVNATLRNPPRR
jgi:hypothetical protein